MSLACARSDEAALCWSIIRPRIARACLCDTQKVEKENSYVLLSISSTSTSSARYWRQYEGGGSQCVNCTYLRRGHWSEASWRGLWTTTRPLELIITTWLLHGSEGCTLDSRKFVRSLSNARAQYDACIMLLRCVTQAVSGHDITT